MAGAALLVIGLLLHPPRSSCLEPQSPAQEDPAAARTALRKLAERAAGLRTLTSSFIQYRRTPLMREPIKSSGTLQYRRDPEKLVFLFAEPRASVVHLDRALYRVYRPDEKRLEEFELGESEGARWLFMAFNPKLEEIEKSFKVSAGEHKAGAIEVILEPTEQKVQAVLRRLTLRLKEDGSSVERISYVDAEGDEVAFELSSLTLDPALPLETFDLTVPDGVRVLRHKRRSP